MRVKESKREGKRERVKQSKRDTNKFILFETLAEIEPVAPRPCERERERKKNVYEMLRGHFLLRGYPLYV